MTTMKWVNGDLVINGEVSLEALDGMMRYYERATKRNEQIIKRAEMLAKMAIETDGVIAATKEVKRYIETHTTYEHFGITFDLKKAKELVFRVKEQG